MIPLILSALIHSRPAIAYQWRNVQIVGGGFVSGIIPHPTSKGLIYVRTDIGGSYRFDSSSHRFVPIEDWITLPDWNLYGTESLAIDPSDPSRVYIAAGTYTNEWGSNGAILRSQDQGKTWLRTNLPFKLGGNMDGRSIGERLQVDPNDGRILLFGSRADGLWRSDDAGKTWHFSGFAPEGSTNGFGVGWEIFDPASAKAGAPSQTIYAGVMSKATSIYRSTDGGGQWLPVAGQPVGYLPLQAKLTPAGNLVVAYSNAPGPNGVTDGAVYSYDPLTGIWKDLTPERPSKESSFGYAGVAVDPQNPLTIMVSTLDRWSAGDTIFRSSNGGESWTSLKEKAVMDAGLSPFLAWGKDKVSFGHWMGDLEIDPLQPNRAWYVTGATLWGTDDLQAADEGKPTHWSVWAGGIEETAVLELVSPPKGAHVISALGDVGGFAHFDLDHSPAGGIWTNPLFTTTTGLDFAESQPQIVVRVGEGSAPVSGGVSQDGGQTWKPFVTGPGSRRAGSVAISADARVLLWAPSGGAMFFSKDLGTTWSPSIGPGAVSRVIADRVDPRVFYAYNRESGTTFRSSDQGKTFRAGQSWLVTKEGKLTAVMGKKGHLWLPTPSGLYRSTDGGTTYQKLTQVVSANQVSFGRAASLGGYPTIFLIGQVGERQGAFRSTDEGSHWSQINDAKTGYGTMDVICGDPKKFGRVYVGTNGRGVLVADPVPR